MNEFGCFIAKMAYKELVYRMRLGLESACLINSLYGKNSMFKR